MSDKYLVNRIKQELNEIIAIIDFDNRFLKSCTKNENIEHTNDIKSNLLILLGDIETGFLYHS